MSIRRLVALPLVGLVLGALLWSLGRAGGPSSADPTPAPAGAAQTAPGVDGTIPDMGSATPGASSPGASGPGASSASGSPVRAGRHGSSEILPSPSSAPSRAAGLPVRTPSTTAPLIPRPLPRPATGNGTLALGFPTVLAPPTRDTIAVSSLAGSGGALQAGLTASCHRPCDPLRRYRVRLAARGFAEIAVPSVENRPTVALQRGTDSVTVSISATGGDTVEYALLAVLHANGA